MLGRGAESRKELGRRGRDLWKETPQEEEGRGRQREMETESLAREGQSGRAKNGRWERSALLLRAVGSRRGGVGTQGMGDTMETLLLCCSVTKSCLTLCDPMDCSMPGFPVLPCLPEFAQTHVHGVSDIIFCWSWALG